MTKTTFLLAALLATTPLSAQNTKGALPINQPTNPPVHQTRAVVVGISDYQDVGIPDLRFADRDAEAFVEWLKSPAGGSVPTENIRLLIGEKAKNAQIVADLDGLAENAQEGDLIIIYFSGHGDVETKTFNQLGFLLAWDSAPTNYKAGAYSLGYLQDMVSTISLLKKARVVVITDACHAGKLAGSTFGGAQIANSNLAKQFANEVKIMSCQPNELALEGEQWGGGRGAFSFNLLEGLTGLADKNADATVSLYEIDRYLGDVVPQQTAPHSQIPMVVGDKQFLLSRVDAPALAALKEMNAGKSGSLATTGGKGFAEGLLADADSVLLHLYHDFETALEKGELLEGNPSADELFVRLSKEEKLRPLHGLMRRNLAAALQNEPQQALNALLADDPYETNNFNYNPSKYKEYARYLARTIELLGEKHYMYPALRSKQLYFESYNLTQSLAAENITRAFQDSIRPIAQQKLREALALDSVSGYLYYAYALTFYNTGDTTTFDSIFNWHKEAVRHSPQWLLPYLELAGQYQIQSASKNEGAMEFWMNSALKIKPNSYVVQERLSWLYQWQNRTDESLALSDKMIQERPEIFNAYSAAGVTCLMRKEFGWAEQYFQKALAIESGPNTFAKIQSPVLLAKTRRQQQAIALADSIFRDPSLTIRFRGEAYFALVEALISNSQFELALQNARKLEGLETNPFFESLISFVNGMYQIESGNLSEGRALLQKAMKTNPDYFGFTIYKNRFEARIEEKEGNIRQADSLFQDAFRVVIPQNTALVVRLTAILESLQKDYGLFLLRQNREPEALAQFQKILEEEPNSWRGYFCMAVFHAKKGHQKDALDWLEKSLDRWLPTAELVTGEPLFSKIRKTKRFETMMLKNFPPGWEKR